MEIKQIEDKVKSLIIAKLDLEGTEIDFKSSITNDLGEDSLTLSRLLWR